MKTTLTIGELRGLRGLRCVRCVAVINPSSKLGIPRRYQKTWSLKTVAPEYTKQQMEGSFLMEAKRWEQKIMAKIKTKEVKTETDGILL